MSSATPAVGEADLGIDGLRDAVLIGQGGFGAVYRAEQPALGRTVAAKILSALGLDDATHARFIRECVAVGALSGHPHIVTIYDAGINAWGRPFIVMDFMARGSITDRIALDGPMPWPDATDMGVKLSGAVASAHAVGILHRDIKPQNVLISAYGEPKLSDFGISSIGGDHTNSGTITASLEHAAPELLEGSTATTSTDVYALASTIFAMVAGESPFARRPDEPIQSLIARIVGGGIPDLRPRGVPGAVCDVLERALAKDPSVRYATAEQFATALRDAQEQLGLAPSAFVDTAPADAFSLVDRFAATRTGTTAPTRARRRDEYVPPAPAPVATPWWKRPIAIAAMTFIVLAIAAGAFALTRETSDETPTDSPASVADTTDEDATDGDARTKSDRKQQGRNGGDDKKKDGRRFAGGGGGGGIPPPLPPSSGSSGSSAAGSGGGTSQEAGSGAQNSTGGGTKKKKQQPSHPPPPRTWLYHVWSPNGRQHRATSDPSYYPDEWNSQSVGLVYNYPEDEVKTIEIDTHAGPFWIFAERFGDTQPDVSRTDLWRMTKGDQFFFTQSVHTKNTYRDNGWGYDIVGFIGEPQ